MTKLIGLLIVVAVLYGGWNLFLYWDKVKNEEETAKKQAAAAAMVNPDQFPGVPSSMESSLQAAKKQGATGLGNWLKTYDRYIQDPRKAWLQLDYCVLIAQKDPAEARRVFKDVKERTPPSSPVFSRIKALEKTYE
jgi:hypothetical protein